MAVIAISRALRERLGDQGADDLTSTLAHLEAEFKKDVIDVVSLRFESKLAQELTLFRAEFQKRFSDHDIQFSEIGRQFVEVHKQFSEVGRQFVEVHKQFSEVHKAIAAQTKWILVIFLGTATLISLVLPFVWRLAERAIP